MNTLFLLMAQFNSPAVPVDRCASYFGLSEREAMNRAALNKLPIPAFRLRDSQKAPMMLHVEDLAMFIDRQRASASNVWEKVNSL